jgi:hypothetical protein
VRRLFDAGIAIVNGTKVPISDPIARPCAVAEISFVRIFNVNWLEPTGYARFMESLWNIVRERTK